MTQSAVDAGFTAISVPNHGGNNLDGTAASVRALPAIADAIGDWDRGAARSRVRRGSDVVKALALGAQAVLIGRAPYLCGLAAHRAARRQPGVKTRRRSRELGADCILRFELISTEVVRVQE
jgi:pre-mycofactocin synthase